MRRRGSRTSRAFGGAALVALALASNCGGDKFTAATPSADGGGLDDGSGASDARPEAAAPGFCATNPGHFFCDDFDRDPGDVKGPWDVIVSTGTGSVTIDPAQWRSPPNALFATTRAGLQDKVTAGVEKTVARGRDFHATFDLYVDSFADPSGQLTGFVMSFDFGQGIALSLGVQSPTSAYVIEADGGGAFHAHPLRKGLAPNQWVRVRADVSLASTANPSGSIKVTFDGVSVLDDHLNLNSVTALSDARFSIGVFPAPGTTPNPWAFRFDNVLLDHE